MNAVKGAENSGKDAVAVEYLEGSLIVSVAEEEIAAVNKKTRGRFCCL